MDEAQAPSPSPPRRLPRSLKRLGLAACLLVSLGLAFGLGAWVTIRIAVRRSAEIATPNVVGLDAGAAQDLLTRAGLSPEIAARRFDPRQPEGKVLGQMPAPGGSTRPGRPVRLIVSLGLRRATVPELVGGGVGRALLELRGASLGAEALAQAWDSAAPAGQVIAQHPPASAEAMPGEKVVLLTSAGARPALYVMPDVVGRPAARVVAALTGSGFRHVRALAPGGETRGVEVVKAQEPKPGYPVSRDDAITLTVQE